MAYRPRLFEPIEIRGVRARNRVWVSPMCQWAAGADGLVRPWHHVNYLSYAAGGAGLVMFESTAVAAIGRLATGDLGLWNDAQVEALKPLTKAISDLGAIPAVQLNHAGRKASTTPGWYEFDPRFASDQPETWATVGPSAIENDGLPVPRELSEAEIGGIVEEFAAAARRAVQAGFRVIELHAAHGFLIHQFLSPLANQRHDRYGGTLEHRATFFLDVVRAVRDAIGGEVPLFARLSATDWIPGGLDLAETQRVAKWAKAAGVDHFDVSSGGIGRATRVPVGPGYMVPFAQAVRQASGATANAVGMITARDQAEQILVADQADAVMMGRAFMRNPHLAAEWAGQWGLDLRGTVAAPWQAARWGK
ncbi:MAG: NADH:flavin oxidoreductase/NADH oxidase [Bifidobacteriaceae bacterium]|nr:NADH:flavin oxidoreductase/NADH oxidase [Bifidobacteriaceae bacterium]